MSSSGAGRAYLPVICDGCGREEDFGLGTLVLRDGDEISATFASCCVQSFLESVLEMGDCGAAIEKLRARRGRR